MTYLHFNITLQDLRQHFEGTLESYVRYFARIFYPPERTARAATYLYNKQSLRNSPNAQSLIDLALAYCFHPSVEMQMAFV